MLAIETIISEKGLLTLRENLTTLSSIKEISSNTIWEVHTIGNNYNDLWLRKKGTAGQTKKTFKRIYLKRFSDILQELVNANIEPSENLIVLVKSEKETEIQILEKSELSIFEFKDKEKAVKYIAAREGRNSHQYRTYMNNKALKIGGAKGEGQKLLKRCHELVSLG